jgi:Glyoxalase-like domain
MAALDHVVINTLRNMDAAAECFEALGFTLTPRGYHSLGSINHLMMTPGPYLELIGLPENGPQRQELLDSGYGLDGLVVHSEDADADFARLTEAGLPAQPPGSFSRPVTIAGQTLEARFRTVRFPADTFPGGRLYFCEHLTPELVWREEWLSHPNGFCGIDRFVIESPDAENDSRRFAAAFPSHAARCGNEWLLPLADARVHVLAASKPSFASVDLVFEHLDEIERRALVLSDVVWWRKGPREATITLPALNLDLTCRCAR